MEKVNLIRRGRQCTVAGGRWRGVGSVYRMESVAHKGPILISRLCAGALDLRARMQQPAAARKPIRRQSGHRALDMMSYGKKGCEMARL